jgi:DNA recombination protein RmuC
MPAGGVEQAFDEEDESRRADLLLQHAKAIGTYASELGRKAIGASSISRPISSSCSSRRTFLSAAAERAPKLIETAFKDQVIIASTINMLALAKIMAGMWRQESLAHRPRKSRLGKELHARLQIMGSHVVGAGPHLARHRQLQ